MDYRLDEIDKRIIYHLAADARNTSAPAIAEEVHVSAGTVRNRIDQLEEHGVIRGYHAHVDYERAAGSLTNVYACTAPAPERERLASKAVEIPGVVNVREMMTGRENLHVKAVGADTADLTRIARELSALGLDIEDEDLLRREHFHPYHPYGPDDDQGRRTAIDFLSLAGEAEVIDVTVAADAPAAGEPLAALDEAGLLGEDVLVVAIERDDEVVTPKGDTDVRAGDLVTLFCRAGDAATVAGAFTGEG